MNKFAKIAVAGLAIGTLAACDPPRVYTDYANKVNAEREALNLKSWEWSPTEKRVMGPVVAIVAGHIIYMGNIATAGNNCYRNATASELAAANAALGTAATVACVAVGF